MPTEPLIHEVPYFSSNTPDIDYNSGLGFALPDIKSYADTFKDDGTPKIEEIDFETRFNTFLNMNKSLSAPIRELSYAETKRYRDPNIAISPFTNLEETYAVNKPTTWFGEQGSIPKMFETLNTNLFSSTQTFFSGLKAISNGGDLSSLIDNDYTQQLAENTKRIEEMRPLYQTKDQMEHPFRYRNWGNTIKQAVPSGGTALSAMVEMAAMEAIFIAAGEAVGGPFGGGAGAIGGVARNFAALPKYIKAIRSSANSSKEAFKAISQVSKRLNGVTNMTRPAISGAKYVGTSLYAANGEAALEAVMSAEEFVESEIRLFMLANNGRGPNQAELDEIKRRAAKVRDTTYGINLATLTVSGMIQFPSVLKGRWAGLSAPRFLQAMGARPSTGIMKTLKKGAKDKAGEAIDTMGGLKLKKTNFASTLLRFEGRYGLKPAGFLPDFGTDFFAEGAEEFLQGVASDYASRKYASPNAAGEKQFKSFWDIAVERAGTTEGQLEFVAGGIIGGGMSFGPSAFSNVNDVIGYNSKVDKINSATESLKTQLRQSLEAGGAIEDILQTGNKRTISNNDDKLSRALKSAIHDLAAGHHSRNTVGIAMDQLDMLRDMDLDSFNELLGIQGSENSANELQKENLLNFVSDQFEASSASLEAVYKWGEANPLREDSYFKRVFSQLPLFNMFFRSKANLEDQVWDTLKQDLSRYQVNVNIYEDEVGDVLDRLDEAAEGSGLKTGITEFHNSIRSSFIGRKNISPLKIIGDLVSDVKQRITDASKVDELASKKEKELLEEIKDEADPMKAFMKILDTYSVTDEYKKEINNLMYGATARYVFAQKAESLTYLEGVKTRAKEIVGMMASRYESAIEQAITQIDPNFVDPEEEEEEETRSMANGESRGPSTSKVLSKSDVDLYKYLDDQEYSDEVISEHGFSPKEFFEGASLDTDFETAKSLISNIRNIDKNLSDSQLADYGIFNVNDVIKYASGEPLNSGGLNLNKLNNLFTSRKLKILFRDEEYIITFDNIREDNNIVYTDFSIVKISGKTKTTESSKKEGIIEFDSAGKMKTLNNNNALNNKLRPVANYSRDNNNYIAPKSQDKVFKVTAEDGSIYYAAKINTDNARLINGTIYVDNSKTVMENYASTYEGKGNSILNIIKQENSKIELVDLSDREVIKELAKTEFFNNSAKQLQTKFKESVSISDGTGDAIGLVEVYFAGSSAIDSDKLNYNNKYQDLGEALFKAYNELTSESEDDVRDAINSFVDDIAVIDNLSRNDIEDRKKEFFKLYKQNKLTLIC